MAIISWNKITKRDRIGYFLVFSVIAICLLIIAGWLFDIPSLKNFMSTGIAMRPSSACCHILVSITLLLLKSDKPISFRNTIVSISGITIILISLSSIMSYALDLSGVENIFRKVQILNSFLLPENRMAFFAAVLFTLFGTILLFLIKHQGIAHGLTLVTFLVAYFVPVSYILGITSMYSVRHTPVAFISGLCFCFLSVAIFLFFSKTWFMKVFASKFTAGYLIQKLLPGIFLAPLIIGWLRLNGEKMGFFTTEIGVVLMIVTFTFFFIMLLWTSARPLIENDLKQVQLNEALRQSEEQYRHLVESSNSIIMRLDRMAHLIFVNEYSLRFFGYSREEMIGKNVMMIVPGVESTGRDLSSLIPDILENSQKYPIMENENIKKNGERVWIAWTNRIINDKNGNPVEILTIGNDITEKKEAEKRLAQERKLFEGIVDNIPVMITIYDPEMQNFRFNKSLKEITGWTEDDAADGLFITKVYPDPEYRREVIDYMSSLKPGWKEWRMTTKDGKYIESSWANIFLSNGVQIGIGIDIRERKKAEAALRKNELRLTAIFNNAAIGIVVTDENDRFIDVNDRLCKILDYTHEELIGKTVSELTAPEDRSLSDSMNSRLHEGDFKTFDYEKRYLKKGGTPIWVHVTVSAIRDPQGKHINSVGTVENITGRRRAEEALRESEAMLRSIMENMSEGLVIFDHTGNIILQNPSSVQIHNNTLSGERTKFEQLTLNWEVSSYPDGSSIPSEQWSIPRVLRGERFKDEVFFVDCIEDPERSFIGSYNGCPVYNTNGEFAYGFLTIRDIREQIRAEEALKESEEIFSTMVQVLPIGIVLTNSSDQKIFKVNPAWLKITGFSSEEEVVGKTSAELRIVRDVERQKRYYEEFLKAGKVRNFEFETFTTSGDQRTVLVNMEPVSIGKQGYFLTSIADISVQKSMELELRHQNEELTRFIYTVSHDLKSPLVTIKSFTSYLEEDIASDDKEAQAKDFRFIKNAAEKMARLLEELLELSRIGRKEDNKVEVPMKIVAQSAMDLVAGRISQGNVNVIITGPDVILFGYQQRFLQLYQNLIDNAVKFMGAQPEPLIEIGSFIDADKSQIIMFVRDNGSGIDPKFHHKLFGLFEKLDNSTEGTGIGLSLIKRIVEVHGGSIWFTSEGLGKGTTFYFTLSNTRLMK